MSQKYAHEDWVVPVDAIDCDGNVRQKKRLKPCTSDVNQEVGIE